MSAPFEKVSRDEFDSILSKSAASPVFRKEFARYDPQYYEGWEGPDCMIHRGDLAMAGHFEVAFYTLIIGNLHVDGIVDLHNPYDKGFDEGGLFVVLGDVTCNAFFNEYGKCTFIDGKLEARDLLVNAFGDSSLIVTGSLATNFYYGRDMWVEVGGNVSMEYGDGYSVPIGFEKVARQKVLPRQSVDASYARLNLTRNDDELRPSDFRDHLLAGKALLRP